MKFSIALLSLSTLLLIAADLACAHSAKNETAEFAWLAAAPVLGAALALGAKKGLPLGNPLRWLLEKSGFEENPNMSPEVPQLDVNDPWVKVMQSLNRGRPLPGELNPNEAVKQWLDDLPDDEEWLDDLPDDNMITPNEAIKQWLDDLPKNSKFSPNEIQEWLDDLPDDGALDPIPNPSPLWKPEEAPPVESTWETTLEALWKFLHPNRPGNGVTLPEPDEFPFPPMKPAVDPPVDPAPPVEQVADQPENAEPPGENSLEPQLPKVEPWNEEGSHDSSDGPSSNDILEPPTEPPLPSIEGLLGQPVPPPALAPPTAPVPALLSDGSHSSDPAADIPDADEIEDHGIIAHEPGHADQGHRTSSLSMFTTIPTAVTSTPTTFATLAKPQASAALSSGSSSSSGSLVMITNLPPECQNFDDYLSLWEALETLNHESRKYCDAVIAGLDQYSKRLWANSVSSQSCVLDPNGEWRTPQGDELVDTTLGCNFAVASLTKSERRDWVDAMLIERCPEGKHQNKSCMRISSRLQNIAKQGIATSR